MSFSKAKFWVILFAGFFMELIFGLDLQILNIKNGQTLSATTEVKIAIEDPLNSFKILQVYLDDYLVYESNVKITSFYLNPEEFPAGNYKMKVYVRGNGENVRKTLDISIEKKDWAKPFEYSEPLHRIISSQDGGYILVGSQLITKFTHDFKTIWEQYIDFDVEDVINTSDNGVILVGEDMVLKISALGKVEMEVQFDGKLSDVLEEKTGIIVVGSTQSFNDGFESAYFARFDKVEKDLIEKAFTPYETYKYIAQKIFPTTDEGYLIIGGEFSYSGQANIRVIKLDKKYHMQWQKNIESMFRMQVSRILKLTNIDNSVLVIGNFIYSSPFIVKINEDGEMVWTKYFENEGLSSISSAILSTDGNCLIVGITNSFNTRPDIMVLMLDKDGNILWKKVYGDERENMPIDVTVTPSGEFIILGKNNDEPFILKLTKDGKILK